MRTYDSYKHSGIDWIGKIPSHWEVSKLGNILKPYSVKNMAHLPLLSITREKGVILRGEDPEEANHNFIPDDLSGYKHIKKGQFGMNKMKAWQGSYGYSNFEGIVSPAYYIFDISDKLIGEYFSKTIRSNTFIPFFIQASDGVRIGQWDLSKARMKEIPFYIPPLPEQEAIARFLDDKCAKIDELVAIKELQIDKLKELRQVKIHQAVTKGINPHVEMKDSGIDWIGEIPKHWEVKRFSTMFKLGKGLTITKENLQEKGIYCVNYGEIHSNYGFEVNPKIHQLKCVSEEYLETSPKSLVSKGDFIFADTSEDIQGSGSVTHLNSNEKVFAGYHTVIAKPIKNINSRFLAYEFDSELFRNQIRVKVKGVKVYSITQFLLKNLNVWIPPLSEQEAIVAYLDEATNKIDQAIAQREAQIEKLKAYKQSLINEVVTGKIRVA